MSFAYGLDVQRQPILRGYDSMIAGCRDSTVTIAATDAQILAAFRAVFHCVLFNRVVAHATLSWDASRLNDGFLYLVKVMVYTSFDENISFVMRVFE
jgi:hypothetical protein